MLRVTDLSFDEKIKHYLLSVNEYNKKKEALTKLGYLDHHVDKIIFHERQSANFKILRELHSELITYFSHDDITQMVSNKPTSNYSRKKNLYAALDYREKLTSESIPENKRLTIAQLVTLVSNAGSKTLSEFSKHRDDLIDLGFTIPEIVIMGSASSKNLGAAVEYTLSLLIDETTTLPEEKFEFTHQEIVTLRNANTFKMVIENKLILRDMGFKPKDILKMVSNGNWKHINAAITYKAELDSMGFTKEDIIKMVYPHGADKSLQVLMELKTLASESGIELKDIVSLDEIVYRLSLGKIGRDILAKTIKTSLLQIQNNPEVHQIASNQQDANQADAGSNVDTDKLFQFLTTDEEDIFNFSTVNLDNTFLSELNFFAPIINQDISNDPIYPQPVLGQVEINNDANVLTVDNQNMLQALPSDEQPNIVESPAKKRKTTMQEDSYIKIIQKELGKKISLAFEKVKNKLKEGEQTLDVIINKQLGDKIIRLELEDVLGVIHTANAYDGKYSYRMRFDLDTVNDWFPLYPENQQNLLPPMSPSVSTHPSTLYGNKHPAQAQDEVIEDEQNIFTLLAEGYQL